MSRGKWTTSVRRTALVAVAWVIVAALFAFLHRRPKGVEWAFAQGNIRETRIVAAHALQAAWGGQLTWKAEYKVAYTIAGHEYAVWADSGVRGDDEDGVRMALPPSPPSCRVRYNPRRPEASIATCK